MTGTFKACFEKLEALSTQELDRSVAELVLIENRNVALVIADRLGSKRIPARQSSSLASDSRSRLVAATSRSSRGGRKPSSSATRAFLSTAYEDWG